MGSYRCCQRFETQYYDEQCEITSRMSASSKNKLNVLTSIPFEHKETYMNVLIKVAKT